LANSATLRVKKNSRIVVLPLKGPTKTRPKRNPGKSRKSPLNYSSSIRAKRLPASVQAGLRNHLGTGESPISTGTINRAWSMPEKCGRSGSEVTFFVTGCREWEGRGWSPGWRDLHKVLTLWVNLQGVFSGHSGTALASVGVRRAAIAATFQKESK
jgi:hypothetical protein